MGAGPKSEGWNLENVCFSVHPRRDGLNLIKDGGWVFTWDMRQTQMSSTSVLRMGMSFERDLQRVWCRLPDGIIRWCLVLLVPPLIICRLPTKNSLPTMLKQA